MRTQERPILIVEDDEVDASTLTSAFRDLNIPNEVKVAVDGEEGIKFLTDAGWTLPCLILLDLNMPRMGGLEFLRWVKSEGPWKPVPVVVFTTSDQEQDKLDSFSLGAAGYMLKPMDYSRFVEMIRAIDQYWTLSEIP